MMMMMQSMINSFVHLPRLAASSVMLFFCFSSHIIAVSILPRPPLGVGMCLCILFVDKLLPHLHLSLVCYGLLFLFTLDQLHHIVQQSASGLSQMPMLKSKWTPHALASSKSHFMTKLGTTVGILCLCLARIYQPLDTGSISKRGPLL